MVVTCVTACDSVLDEAEGCIQLRVVRARDADILGLVKVDGIKHQDAATARREVRISATPSQCCPELAYLGMQAHICTGSTIVTTTSADGLVLRHRL